MKSQERRDLEPIPDELLSSDDESNDDQDPDQSSPPANLYRTNLATCHASNVGNLSQELNRNLSGKVKSI